MYGEEDGEVVAGTIVALGENWEGIILTLMTVIGAVTLSFVGLLLGYYSIQEDWLMRRYKRRGVKVHGSVQYAELTKTHRATQKPCSRPGEVDKPIKEYTAVVHYRQTSNDSEMYRTSIRKQMTALETDFVHEPNSKPLPTVIVQFDLGDKANLRNNSEDFSSEVARRCGDESLHSLDLLVLPEYPRSALPRQQVERGCSLWNRLPTYFLIVCIISIAVGCGLLSLHALSLHTVHYARAIAGVVTVALFSMEMLIIRFFLDGWIQSSLRNEYLDGEDFACGIQPCDTTTSTLSSHDSMLM